MKIAVLVSGGIDSATCLALAVKQFGNKDVVAINIYYNQKNSKELSCCESLVKHYSVQMYRHDLSSIFKNSSCTLINNSEVSSQKGKNNSAALPSSYVYFRNGLMVSVAASICGSLYQGEDIKIWYGAHKDDSEGLVYADCTKKFINLFSQALVEGTYGKTVLKCPLIEYEKSDVVKLANDLDVPFEHTWTCYGDSDKACGKCTSCILRKRAFEKNGLTDPVKYW